MRTFYILLKIFVAVFIFNGCSSEKLDMPSKQQEDNEMDPVAVIAQINGLTTRTALDISSNVVWTSGDEILIWSATTPGEVYSTASHNTRTGIFLPVGKPVNDETRYALYPASIASETELTATSIEIDLKELVTQSYTRSLTPNTDISALPMVAVSNNQNFTFKNICGGIQLQLNDYQSRGIKIKSITMTSKGKEQITGKVSVDVHTGDAALKKDDGQNTITIDCGDGINISSGGNLADNSGFVIFLPAGEYTDGFHFSLIDTEGRCYEVETTQTVTVAAGVITPLRSLPLTLYYGDANSYRTVGSETINIDVTPYYTFSENYVHENLTCLDAAGKTVGLPNKAKIVWQQVNSNNSGEVVSNLLLEGTVLHVTTAGNPGNALVAICDDKDEILWSYHIWVSEAEDITFMNESRGTFKMMDRHLGATSKTLKDRNAYGLFYQWGRKDPFARNLTVARPGGSPYENPPSDLQNSSEVTTETGTIAYANRNPQTRLLSASDWYSGAGGNDNLWGFIDQNGGVKTVYDPCPTGYRVADYNCFAKLPDDDKVNCNNQFGYMMQSGSDVKSYYPTGGYLVHNKNVMQYMEYRGYLWNNQPGTGPNTAVSLTPNRFFYNNAGLAIDKSEYRSAGMPVRCVRIE